MKRNSFLATVLCFGIFFSSLSVLAQEADNSSQSALQFNKELGSFYYQDALTSQLAKTISPAKGLIDIESYILGPGDLISINIEANQPILLRGILINPQGEIVTPLTKPISVNDLQINEAELVIKEVLENTFRTPKVTITLEQPRSVSVYISGGVPYPGKYHHPPFSRVDEAIYPSVKKLPKNPSLDEVSLSYTSELLENQYFDFRNITLVRENGDTLIADLTSYFKTGDLSSNPLVYDSDHIIVKRVTEKSPEITISGAVASNQEIQFKSSDTPQHLIELAGGYTPEANTELIYIFRSNNGDITRIDLPKEEWANISLKPNDRLVVPEIKMSSTSTSAEVYGEVNLPGYFPVVEGKTTAFDLLSLAGGTTESALVSAAFLSRRGDLENEALNKFNVDLMSRTSDQLSQGFEYLELETRNSQNRVHIDLKDEAQLRSLKIYNGDKLFIPRDENTVFVFGQVNNPGYYSFSSSQKVSDYINRAGNFALAADKERVFIIKAGINTWYKPSETNLESGDKIFVDRKPYEELNALRSYEIQKQQLKNTRIQLVMTGLTTITSIITAYVAITRN
jgi:protein involved in polysaccharide export with SLBB domain